MKSSLIGLRYVEKKDAEFILKLRQNELLNKYISKTDIEINQQIRWIEEYKEREAYKKEFYFIIENKETNENYGTVRIYNILNEKATFGSFILDKNRPDNSVYKVIDLALDFAFKDLRVNEIYLDVIKENKKAIYVYKKYGFKYIGEDNIAEFYKIYRKDFTKGDKR